MRKIALVSAAVLALTAFVSVSSASALSWTPQGTKTTIKRGSDFKLIVGTYPFIVECNTYPGGLTGTASGATMNWSNFTWYCSPGFYPGEPVNVVTKGVWSATATSTSAVTLKGETGLPGYPVLEVYFTYAHCQAVVSGPVTSTGATWSNSTHALTLNNTLPVKSAGPNAGYCEAPIGKSITLKGTLQHESNVAILP